VVVIRLPNLGAWLLHGRGVTRVDVLQRTPPGHVTAQPSLHRPSECFGDPTKGAGKHARRCSDRLAFEQALQVVEDVDQDGQVIGHDRDPPAGVLVAGDTFGLEAVAHGID
jgi:hypothetical protein